VTWEEYTAAWSELHGGFDPAAGSPLVRGWVRLAYAGGSLLARLRIGPMAVTGTGLALSAAVPFAALPGPGGLLLGGVLVLLASFADGLDGAVAVLAGKVSRLGFVVDSVADRLGEAAWLAAFWLAGAPGWVVVAAGAVSWLHEYLRARATAGGMRGIGAVTVAERPTRVSVAISGLVVGGVAGLLYAGWEAAVLTAAGVVWLALGLIGLAQLTAAVRRELAGNTDDR
jgi:CDP-diacylglycerol--glycerol-3-phosphate 3-phosphatidyltransferase